MNIVLLLPEGKIPCIYVRWSEISRLRFSVRILASIRRPEEAGFRQKKGRAKAKNAKLEKAVREERAAKIHAQKYFIFL